MVHNLSHLPALSSDERSSTGIGFKFQGLCDQKSGTKCNVSTHLKVELECSLLPLVCTKLATCGIPTLSELKINSVATKFAAPPSALTPLL